MIKQLFLSPFFSLWKTHSHHLILKIQITFLLVRNVLIHASGINHLIFVSPLNLTVTPFLYILLFVWEIIKRTFMKFWFMVICRIYWYYWKTAFNRVLNVWWTKALLLNAEGRREMGERCLQSGDRMQSSQLRLPWWVGWIGTMPSAHVGMANLWVDTMGLTLYKYSATQ